MSFKGIIGQDRVITILKNIKKYEKIAHAYIFAGPVSCGKTKTALEFAKVLNCENPTENGACDSCRSCNKINNEIHPEVKLYRRDKASISIDIVRDIQKSLQYTKAEAKYRVIIIEDADKMTKDAANCFLKTLEEPPESTIIILLTSVVSSLLKTILSRCQIIKFKALIYEEKMAILKNLTDNSLENIENTLSLCGENINDALNFMESSDINETISKFLSIKNQFESKKFDSNLQRELEFIAKDKENFSRFLTFLLNKVELENSKKFENEEYIKHILKAKKYFNKNVNPKLIWSWLYLRL